MGRWEPGARERLVEAALDLFADPGFEETTVADIAARAGVTERTFFRHFADKREVLFAGSDEFQATVLTAIEAAPAGLSPLEAASAGMEAAAAFLQSRPDREFPRRRAAAIAANRSLQERELLKLATVATESARALAGRGVPVIEAAVAAEAAMAAFRLAFERWVTAHEVLDLRELVRERVAAFRTLA
ncbi:TetR family transcriptional regulator [Leifsonia xyli]|uniref:TetR/AcrR family transcriptional regulator n=1 Tax=Leifsonia xyli TaxID=1575 RepID=UPI0007CDE032|nr:TetR family transcriptional regulator [Leifsonia xyli]